MRTPSSPHPQPVSHCYFRRWRLLLRSIPLHGFRRRDRKQYLLLLLLLLRHYWMPAWTRTTRGGKKDLRGGHWCVWWIRRFWRGLKWIERLVWRLGGIDCPMLMQAMEFFGAWTSYQFLCLKGNDMKKEVCEFIGGKKREGRAAGGLEHTIWWTIWCFVQGNERTY